MVNVHDLPCMAGIEVALQGPVQVPRSDKAPSAGALGGQNRQSEGQAVHVPGDI